MLIDKIINKQSGIVLYGITPPKASSSAEKIAEISDKHIQRLQNQPLDGLVIYDIQDESTRTAEQRPFPFIKTLDASTYSQQYLTQLNVPKIIYRAVGKYTADELSEFISKADVNDILTVFVGAASKNQNVSVSLPEAYRIKSENRKELLLGGVTIPERHTAKGDEHMRVFSKISQGCSFFISQGVYDVSASKDFLSDYYYHSKAHNIELAPIIFTLTPCGSAKTLEFMKWLGISIPRWLENELLNANDILEQSLQFCLESWNELKTFAKQKNIPIGCNIESVAIRKVEIDASIELLQEVSKGQHYQSGSP